MWYQCETCDQRRRYCRIVEDRWSMKLTVSTARGCAEPRQAVNDLTANYSIEGMNDRREEDR